MIRKRNFLLLIMIVIVLLGVPDLKADFTIGEPTNLGPTINSSANDSSPTITADGLTLYFNSNRPGGLGDLDIWITTRTTTNESWGEPVNLGPTVNTAYWEWAPSISYDGLELYFNSNRPGPAWSDNDDLWVTSRTTLDDGWSAPLNLGPTVNSSFIDWSQCISADGLELFFMSNRSGNDDIWVTTRATTSDPWGTPVNLGPTVNSPSADGMPNISIDGRMLFFHSNRPGGLGSWDIWVTKRETISAEWSTPVNLGPPVNSSDRDGNPCISADGSTIFFWSTRPGGSGGHDLWQAQIKPVVDLNSDGIVDADDMCIIVDHWGTDESLCDVGPMPWGDGIVDVQDLIVLAEHLFEEIPPTEPVE